MRGGADVLKMLALGADAVMIGRADLLAAMGGLAEGVAAYCAALRTELMQAMVMTGTESIARISPSVLYSRGERAGNRPYLLQPRLVNRQSALGNFLAPADGHRIAVEFAHGRFG